MIKESAVRAGIEKPVNPHHFRHSRATLLAKKLTEANLCEYMGWIQGSKEASTYVHLSGRDTDKAILAMHGLINEEEKKDKFKPRVCPRCKTINDPASNFCSGCSLGLDEKTLIEFDKQKEEATDLGMILKKAKSKDEIKEMLRPLLMEMLKGSDKK